MAERRYFVYILASRFKTLYVGVTNDLGRRLAQHRERRPGSYTARYRIDRLVHYETFQRPGDAIRREKEIKAWRREKKEKLVEQANPAWRNLFPKEV
jgi:putative endonuclease